MLVFAVRVLVSGSMVVMRGVFAMLVVAVLV